MALPTPCQIPDGSCCSPGMGGAGRATGWGVAKAGGGVRGSPTACTCQEWGGEGVALVPFCLPPAPHKPICGPTAPWWGVGWGHSEDAARPLLWGWRAGWYPGANPWPLGGEQAGQQCCTPWLCQPPAPLRCPCHHPWAGIPGRGLAWCSGAGWGPGCSPPHPPAPLPPSSRGVKNSALVMNI